MSALVKICGLSTEATLVAAVEAGADWVGLVPVPKSPRFVSLDRAAALAGIAAGRARIAVLLVDPDDATVAAALSAVCPDALQLHGAETPERVAAIKRLSGDVEVWKALPVSEAADLDRASAYAAVDRWLFDAKPPSGADRTGGHGAAFDWTLLAGRRFDRPWFLAGGLDPSNVAEAVRLTGAPAVDVSSGVERERGLKDPALISAFLSAVRQADAAPLPSASQSRE